jgi:hypothetical protein
MSTRPSRIAHRPDAGVSEIRLAAQDALGLRQQTPFVALTGSKQQLRARVDSRLTMWIRLAKRKSAVSSAGIVGSKTFRRNVPHGADDGPARLERRIVGHLRAHAGRHARPRASATLGRMSADDVCHTDHRIVAASAPRDHVTVTVSLLSDSPDRTPVHRTLGDSRPFRA